MGRTRLRRFSAAPTIRRRGGDTAPSYDSSVRRRTPRVHRNRRGTRTVVEGRASIVTSPGGTAAPAGLLLFHRAPALLQLGVLHGARASCPGGPMAESVQGVASIGRKNVTVSSGLGNFRDLLSCADGTPETLANASALSKVHTHPEAISMKIKNL